MFERFALDARDVVVASQLLARTAGSPSIDSRHVLIGLAQRPGAAADALAAVGVDPKLLAETTRQSLGPGLDAGALASVGIDLDAVRSRTDAVFGEGSLERPLGRPRKGHIPFTSEAKKTLELALREAVRLHDTGIDNRHLLLGVLRNVGCPGEQALRPALTAAGSSVEALRSQVERPSAQAS